MSEIDPVTFSVVWNGLVSIAEEMGTALRRSAYSLGVREGRDFSTALFDAQARLIAQGNFSPGHLGSMPFVVKHILEEYPVEELEEGDSILLNDPYLGSGHLPDFFQVSPIFQNGELLGFAANCAHMVDVGGAGPGSQAVDSVDLYQEGIRFLPTRIYHGGRPNREVLRMLESNVRVPDKVMGDLQAQRNANRIGEAGVVGLAESYGMDTLRDCMALILDRSEESMRSAIRELPEGVYEAEDYFDDYGQDTRPLTVKVAVRVKDGGLTVDFAGSSPQTRSGLNSTFNYTRAYSYFTLKALTVQDRVPQNAGCIRPIEVIAPEGSLFNPRPPAAVGPRAIMQQRMVDTILLAMSKAAPDRVIANSSHWANPNYGGIDPKSGKPFVYYEMIIGGVGARPTKDGADGLCSAFNLENIPVEVVEATYPVMIDRIQFVTDSGGPGRYRGGTAMRKDVRVLTGDVVFSNLTDRQVTHPQGLLGGTGGPLGRTLRNPDSPAEETFHSKGTYRLRADDVVSTTLSGSGGYGIPEERDPDAVLRDVLDGYVSVDAAREIYKVDIDLDSMSLDFAKTNKLRGLGNTNDR